jgi:acetylornithine deacetylase/succinyl-diaminopimelate desuccinylase-like protein
MQKVLDYLKQNERRFIQELCDYVRFPSVSAQAEHRSDLLACARWLQRHCRQIGLEARLCPTAGHPVVVARTPRSRRGTRPHYLVYGHYDVQPADPFELWTSPPFEPRLEGRRLFGRGASDNKGQHFAHLKAVEAHLQTGTELPCDLTFIIEGEEEVGSKSLSAFLRKNRSGLRGDGVVVSDNALPHPDNPALTYALRGVFAVEVEVHGPSRDLHSGIYGGAVDNPAMVLCQMLAQLRDKHGHITVPHFYDEVRPLAPYERRQLSRAAGSDRALEKFLGVPKLFGERGFNQVEQRTARPTLEINGLTSGYQGQGSKTIIPALARAKLTVRLVPDQDPQVICRRLIRHLEKICPPTVRLWIETGHAGSPYLVSPEGPRAKAALRALKRAFKRTPCLKREGGSIPIVEDFKRQLGLETLLLGLALTDDNAHSPNEKFDLDCLRKGMVLSTYLWQELARADG